jgi:spectinomycin phosphotransferase
VLDRPDLDDATLAGHLLPAWDVAVSTVEFMPVGNDSHAWAFDVRGRTAERYFLKVRRGPVAPAAAMVPRYLHGNGLRQVVAALPTVQGAPWHEAGDHRLLLYPFVDAESGMTHGLSAAQWTAYGAAG